MRFVGPPSLTGNPGGWGTRGLVALSAEEKKCPVSYLIYFSVPLRFFPQSAEAVFAGTNRNILRADGTVSTVKKTAQGSSEQDIRPHLTGL
jgi:hypothetical protein